MHRFKSVKNSKICGDQDTNTLEDFAISNKFNSNNKVSNKLTEKKLMENYTKLAVFQVAD